MITELTNEKDFDRVFPEKIRELSKTHWTPTEVAKRAAELLAVEPDAKILDIGSGAGKFCVVGALTTTASFFGIEQRPHLVEIAQEAAATLGATRARFIHGDISEIDWTSYSGFYLFNPFCENIAPSIRIDESIAMGRKRYNQCIDMVRRGLRSARLGARVVTYHGFGGEMPMGFMQLLHEPIGTDFLNLWVKTGHFE